MASMTISAAAARKRCSRTHSRPHVLHWALQERLGDGVAQRGADNHLERLRFDFAQLCRSAGQYERALALLERRRIH